jgi:hypothetical protein
MFKQALALDQAGRLPRAEALYRRNLCIIHNGIHSTEVSGKDWWEGT